MITLHQTKLTKQGRRLVWVDELTLVKCVDGSHRVHGDTSRLFDAPLREIAGYKRRLNEAEGYRELRKAIARQVGKGWTVTLGALSASDGEPPYAFRMKSTSKVAREKAFAVLSHAAWDSRVVAGIARIRAAGVRSIDIDLGTPELAVAFALALAGAGTLREAALVQDEQDIRWLAKEMTGPMRTLLIVLGVLTDDALDFGQGIGAEACALAL